MAQGVGYSFFFTDAEAVLSFAPGSEDVAASSGLALGLRFVGADTAAGPGVGARAGGTVNRLTGSSGWQSDVPTYEEIVYRELWPNIDLAVHGQGGELQYEFHLRAGADPRDIRLAYAGADELAIDADGSMVVDTPLGEASMCS